MTEPSRSWICPSCRRRVPARIDRCRCGTERSQAGLRDEVPVTERVTRTRRDVPPIAWVGLGVALTVPVMMLVHRQAAEPPAPSPRARPAVEPAAPPAPESRVEVTAGMVREVPVGLPAEEVEEANELIARVNSGVELTAEHLQRAERLASRFPDEQTLQQLLVAMLIGMSTHARGNAAFADAVTLAQRAVSLAEHNLIAHQALLAALTGLQDWPALEQAALRFLDRAPDRVDARKALAIALARQGRDREALRATYEVIEVGGDDQLLAQRENLERKLWVDSGCSSSRMPEPAREGDAAGRLERFLVLLRTCPGAAGEMKLGHFKVRQQRTLDGASAVRLLERNYAFLRVRLDHELSVPVPVVLHSWAEFQEATRAPGWAGGVFDQEDFRVDMPWPSHRLTGRLPAQRRQELDRLLERISLHELAHAFIHDMSGGRAPREIHEGLAQYFELWRTGGAERANIGERLDQVVDRCVASETEKQREREKKAGAGLVRDGSLTAAEIAAKCNAQRQQAYKDLRSLATGQGSSVEFAYLGHLSFVDHLVRQRSVAGLRDALKTMGGGDSVDESFRRAYGRDLSGLKRAWLDSLRHDIGAATRSRS